MNMKAIYYLLTATMCLLAQTAIGQILNSDADGKSTIVTSGGTTGIDISKAAIRMDYFYFPLTARGWVGGISLAGSNTEGISTLFTNEGIEPEGSASLVIGRKYSTSNYWNDVELPMLNEDYHNKGNSAEKEYSKLVKESFSFTCSEAKSSELVQLLQDIMAWQNKDSIIEAKGKEWAQKQGLTKESCGAFFSQLQDFTKKVKDNKDFEELSKIEKRRNQIGNEMKRKDSGQKDKTRTFIPYIKAGITASEFTRDLGQDSTTFSSRFPDTTRRHLSIETGVSFKSRDWRMGLTAGLMSYDNFDGLKKKTYKFVENDTTIVGGSLSKTQEKVAYAGDFARFGQIILNWDIMRLFKLQDTVHLAGISLYSRTSIPLIQSTIIPSAKMVVGVGLNYFNIKTGKFLGGAYFQTNNLFGADGESFYKSLQFGLTARINFSGFVVGKTE
jgi:hypothetical protein